MANKKETANQEKQAKAVKVYTETQCKSEIERLTKLFTANYDKFLSDTKNGAYKATISKPENKADIKGSATVGSKVWYFVPTGEIRISLSSYIAYLSAIDKLAKQIENFVTFEEWKQRKEIKSFADGLRYAKLSDEMIEDILKEKYKEFKADKLGKDLEESESE